jgi:hypothetical protein
MVVTVLLLSVLFLLSLTGVQPDVLGASLHSVFGSKTSQATSGGANTATGPLQSYVSGQMVVQSCLCEMLSFAVSLLCTNTTNTQAEGLCSNLKEPRERQRLACCSSVNGGVLYLHNVQFASGRIVSFARARDNNGYNLDGTSRTPPSALPAINSITRRKVKEFTMRTETKAEALSLSNCTSYFNGTLHVLGRQTTQNLYHVCKLPPVQKRSCLPLT